MSKKNKTLGSFKSPSGPRKQLEDYIAFLQKRLESENYKAAVSAEEYEEEQAKYDKAKTRMKILFGKNS